MRYYILLKYEDDDVDFQECLINMTNSLMKLNRIVDVLIKEYTCWENNILIIDTHKDTLTSIVLCDENGNRIEDPKNNARYESKLMFWMMNRKGRIKERNNRIKR